MNGRSSVSVLKKSLPWLCIAGVLLFHALGNCLWFSLKTLPPQDDLAYHLDAALDILDASSSLPGMIVKGFSYTVISCYPALFHTVMALFNSAGGRTEAWAVMANLPFMLVLLVSLYYTGRKLGSGGAGLLAGALTMFYPFMFDLARLPEPDFAMTAFVTLSFCLLLYSEEFSLRTPSLLFGIACALGMLAKQVFVFFLYAPLAVTLAFMAREKQFSDKRRLATVRYSLLAAIVLPLLWYLPRFSQLLPVYIESACYFPGYKDLPPVFSADSLLFYIVVLVRSQMGLFFLAFFAVGLCLFLWTSSFKRIALFAAAILGPYAGFVLLHTKHVKTTAPFLPFFALVTALGIMRIPSRTVRALLVGLLLSGATLQFFDVSFAALPAYATGGLPIARRLFNITPTAASFRPSFVPQVDGGASERLLRLLRAHAPAAGAWARLMVLSAIPWAHQSDIIANVSGLEYLLHRDRIAGWEVLHYSDAKTADLVVTVTPLPPQAASRYVLLDTIALPDASSVFIYKKGPAR